MVVIKNLFICGMGTVPLHYCSICGEPYFNMKDAERCERAHIGHQGEETTTILMKRR